MHTQCPKCQTVFKISEQHLAAAHGRVRCSRCQHVFNGRLRLINNLDEVMIKPAPTPPPQAQPPAEEDSEYIDLSAVKTENRYTSEPVTDEPVAKESPPVEETTSPAPPVAPPIEPEPALEPEPVPESPAVNEFDLTSPAEARVIELDSEPEPIVNRPEEPEPAPEPVHSEPEPEPVPAPAPEPEPAPKPASSADPLDAIFASMDKRLEELANHADGYTGPLTNETALETPRKDYTDTFDQPDNDPAATEHAEEIYAEAEAELHPVPEPEPEVTPKPKPAPIMEEAEEPTVAMPAPVLDETESADPEQVPDVEDLDAELDNLFSTDNASQAVNESINWADTQSELYQPEVDEDDEEDEEKPEEQKPAPEPDEFIEQVSEADVAEELDADQIIEVPAGDHDEHIPGDHPAEEFLIMEPEPEPDQEREEKKQRRIEPRIKDPNELFSELIIPGEISDEMNQEELPFTIRSDVEEMQYVKPRRWWVSLLLFLMFLLLITVLASQLALFRNVELANKVPELRPWLSLFCQHAPCQFSGRRDINRIQILTRDVRNHPKEKNALLISLVFVNNAGFAQPFPDIQVQLSDLTSTVVAQRRFKPQDYLAKTRQDFHLMKTRVPVQVTLEVIDPGDGAVNFEFSFK